MAKQTKQKTKQKKGGKKSFYEVAAPLTSTKIFLYSTSPEALDNRTVKIDLTKSLRGKSLEVKMRIKNEDGVLQAVPESTELATSYIRKVMRKGTDYAEDSFEAECKDVKVRIKPLMVTRKRVSRVVLRALREGAKKHLLAYLKTRTAKEIFSEIVSNKIQKQLSLKLKKIYPLAMCEIRVFKILKVQDEEVN